MLWRVESDQSGAQYVEGEGIVAGSERFVPCYPKGWKERRQLEGELMAHLDWSNRVPTPFVSVSSSLNWVNDQAERRCRDGETGVKVYEILLPDFESYNALAGHGVTCMRLDTWLDRADCEIPEYADFPSSKKEYLFLHRIPEEIIVGVHPFDGCSGRMRVLRGFSD